MPSTEVILRGARVLLGDPRDKRLEPIEVRIREGVLSEMGVDLEPGGAEVIDYSGCWIIPGFVDAHQHVWQAVLRGRFADTPYEESDASVRDLVAHAVAPEDVYSGTYGGAVALMDAGVTCTFDHCDAVATLQHGHEGVRGLHEAGIRGVWGYGFDSATAGDGAGPKQRLDDARTLARLVSGRPLLSFGVVPAVRGDAEHFADQVALGAETDASVLTHTDARDGADGVVDSEVWLSRGLLSKGHVHAFCSRTPADMFAEFARLGCCVVSTPDVELGGGLGYTALRQADDTGVNTALGTGSQAVVAPDMFTTMRMGLQSERARYQQAAAEARGTSGISRIAMRTEDVLHFATLGGARALGLGDVCGSIEVGKAADLVVIRPTSPRLAALVDPCAAIVLHMGVADVDAVLVAGEFRKRNGALVGESAERAMDELDASHARIAAAVSAQNQGVPA